MLPLSTQRLDGSCEELGGRNTEYVDRQNVRCGGGMALSAFRFERCSGIMFKFVATCSAAAGGAGTCAGAVTDHWTQCQHARGVRLEYLDRHALHCPAGTALQRFQLTGSGCGGAEMRFHFWCAAPAGGAACIAGAVRTVDSPCQELRGRPGEFLDRQRPACGEGEVMAGFRLHSGGCGGSGMRFAVDCIAVHR